MDTHGTYTTANTSVVNLEDIVAIGDSLQSAFVAQFRGIRVMPSFGLKGNEFICLVSEKVYDQIKKDTK